MIRNARTNTTENPTVNYEPVQTFPPALSELKNESDVENHFMSPLLAGAKPLCLGFPRDWIRSKTNINALPIGKGQSRKIHFPDYLITVDGIPLAVVEVKAPGENLDLASEEARLYATVLNSKFMTGVNPCQLCIISDGLETRVCRWDSETIENSFLLGDIAVGVAAFDAFRQKCDTVNFIAQAEKITRLLSPDRTLRPVSRVGGEHAQSQQIPPNRFGQILVSNYVSLFTPDTVDQRKRIATEAYIKTTRTVRYMDEIERVVDQMNAFSDVSFRSIEDTGSPVEVISEFHDLECLTNQVMLLVGLRGAGKSTFIDHLQFSIFPSRGVELVWVRINFNLAPTSLDELFVWTRREVVRSLREQHPEIQTFTLEALKNIFQSDINRELAYLKDLYGKDSDEYKKALAEKFEQWIADDSRLIRNLELLLCKGRGKLLIIACDNCDKRDPEIQLRVFEVVQWLKTEVRALVILPLRESTYELNKKTPPLDTALKSLVYQINPPPFQTVLMTRIKLLMKEVRDHPPSRLSFPVGPNMTLVFTAERVISFLKSINRSLFNDTRLGKRLLQGLSSKDVREGLSIFLDLCRSGYLPTEDIFHADNAEPQPFPESVTYNMFMKMNHRYFVGDTSLVKNLYQGTPKGRAESHFTRLRICQWLRLRLTEPGPSRTKGFHREEDLVNEICILGHTIQDVINQIIYLGEKGLIIRENSHSNPDGLCCLSPSGFAHLDIHRQYQYIGRCAEDSYIADELDPENRARC